MVVGYLVSHRNADPSDARSFLALTGLPSLWLATKSWNKMLNFFDFSFGGNNGRAALVAEIFLGNPSNAYPYLSTASLDIRLLFSVISITFTAIGIFLRGFIFGYLCSPSETSTLINMLIFFQQFCRLSMLGYCLGFSIVYLLPFSLEDAFGEDFCTGFSCLATFSMFGDIYWSSMLAFTRMLYVKYHGKIRYCSLNLAKIL